ncbi:MraZ protein [Hamadaea flava]|nr:MraZ protein [Hamadaea flava]
MITKGQERCLYVFPVAEFQRYAAEQSARPMSDKAARAYTRVLFSGAHDEVPDKQGRVTIPPTLRAYAGLERDLVVIGASTRVEIWDNAAWEAYLAESEESFSDVDTAGYAGLPTEAG